MSATSKTVARNTPAGTDLDSVPTNADLNTWLPDFEELAAAIQEAGADNVFVGSPYTLLNKDKDVLVNEPFIIRRFIFVAKPNPSDPRIMNDVAIVHVVSKSKGLFVMTDGSTGIRDQLIALEAQRTEANLVPNANILVPNGLTRSDYDAKIDGDTGEVIRPAGTTYFLG